MRWGVGTRSKPNAWATFLLRFPAQLQHHLCETRALHSSRSSWTFTKGELERTPLAVGSTDVITDQSKGLGGRQNGSFILWDHDVESVPSMAFILSLAGVIHCSVG